VKFEDGRTEDEGRFCRVLEGDELGEVLTKGMMRVRQVVVEVAGEEAPGPREEVGMCLAGEWPKPGWGMKAD